MAHRPPDFLYPVYSGNGQTSDISAVGLHGMPQGAPMDALTFDQCQNLEAYQSQYQGVPPIYYPQLQQLPSHDPQPPPKHTEQLPLMPKSGPADGSVLDTSFNSTPPLDYQLLMLSLAEDYFDAAHSQGSMVALAKREMDMHRYYKLIATGLGCLESVLKVGAVLLLIYGDDSVRVELEAAAPNGSVCTVEQRDSSLRKDLKYDMQHLLVRSLFQTNTKAALKSLDIIIQDIEAFKRTSWIYAFRFLRVSLSLELSSHQETLAALHNLRLIASTARDRGDTTVFAICAVLEAITHLRSTSVDSIEQAQRALAAARSLQLDEGRLLQITALIHILDLSCSLQEFNSEQATAKMLAMQTVFDQAGNDTCWADDGSFEVTIHSSLRSQGTIATSSGLVQRNKYGHDRLKFSWLPRKDLYALGYFLSGIATSHKNSFNGQKAELYFQGGIKQLQDEMNLLQGVPESLSSATSRLQWRQTLGCYMRLHLSFALCDRTDWKSATAVLQELQVAATTLGSNIPELMNSLILYLIATVQQGTGNVDAALATYQHSALALPIPGKALKKTYAEISILATINSILILRESSQPLHASLDTLLSAVEPLCLSHPNTSIQSAFYLAKAIAHSTDPIIKTKQYLQFALQAAKSVANTQLMCVTLNFMSWRFFRGVVGEQAEKSARAGMTLAKKGRNSLWTSVAGNMLADTLEVQGKFTEAATTRTEAIGLAESLSPGLYRMVAEDGQERDR
ncbi:MAG: hypothetical protein M1827_003579 [Pycnora praestabilis]|nr:MAG: hypothetical protein M1827_003579 [Pycnora praestabilis]